MFRRKSDGWTAIGLAEGRIDVVGVRSGASGRPEVALYSAFRREGELADDLDRLRRALHLERHQAINILASGQYQMVQIESPNVPAAELKTAARWKVKEMLEFAVESATLDVAHIPDAGASGRPKAVFVVAAPNGLLAERIAAFDAAKIPLQVIDIPEMAQRNVAALYEEPQRALALLAFDATGALLTITAGGELYASRRIDVKASLLAGDDIDRSAQAVDRIGLELQRTLDSFERQYSMIPVSRLLLASVAGVEELREALKGVLYVPVEVLDLAKTIDFSAIPELRAPERQSECLHGVGAALRAQAS